VLIKHNKPPGCFLTQVFCNPATNGCSFARLYEDHCSISEKKHLELDNNKMLTAPIIVLGTRKTITDMQ
jgi:hypothetical protein